MMLIYHYPCYDGFACAWIVYRLLGDTAKVTYHPANHGEPAPDVTGEDVIIADFSYDRDTLLRMRDQAHSLQMYDHHKTAADALEGLSFATFDMDRSGAGLLWDELTGGRPRPWIIDYVEDRDLWRHQLGGTHEVHAFIAATPQTFEGWDRVDFDYTPKSAEHAGKGALAMRRRSVEAIKFVAHWALLDGRDEVVPCVNTSHMFASETVGELAAEYGAPFAIGWWVREDGKVQYSLRSREGGVDVSRIAKAYGGGGHPGAAGFLANGVVHVYRGPGARAGEREATVSDKLDEIEWRLMEGTVGPWEQDGCDVLANIGSDDDPDVVLVADCLHDDADARFIAHAPDDIAWLVAEVRRLRGQNRRLQGLLDGAHQ
jgi:hypothetical protein